MTKVLVAFAMKEEFAPWQRRHPFRRVPKSPHPLRVSVFGNLELYVALAGAGAPDARHFENLTTTIAPSLCIVTGVAAGLNPKLKPGDILAPLTVSVPGSKPRVLANAKLIDLAVECGANRAEVMLTLPRIARTVEEKVRLGSMGDMADMESLPLMKQWSDRDIPSLALRVILDPADMPMKCDFESAMDAHGQVRLSKIAAQLFRHPQTIPDFIHIARQSRRTLAILARFLDCFFERLNHHPLAKYPG
jgi:nucleoside phosphorylase